MNLLVITYLPIGALDGATKVGPSFRKISTYSKEDASRSQEGTSCTVGDPGGIARLGFPCREDSSSGTF